MHQMQIQTANNLFAAAKRDTIYVSLQVLWLACLHRNNHLLVALMVVC